MPPVWSLHEYATPADFAELCHHDLVAAIDHDYGQATYRPKNELDAEFVAHVAFAKPLVQLYVGQQHVYAAIEKYTLKGFFTPQPDADGEAGAPPVFEGEEAGANGGAVAAAPASPSSIVATFVSSAAAAAVVAAAAAMVVMARRRWRHECLWW